MGSKVKLSDVAEVIDSAHKTPMYSETGYSMVRCTDVRYGNLDLSNTLRVDEEVYKEFSRRYKPNCDDIIITRVGSYGLTAKVTDTNFCLGQNTSAIKPKRINPHYLYYVLNSKDLRGQIEAMVVGTTQKTLSLKAINNLEIPRLSEDKEEKIAHHLKTLDDKITLNLEMNKTLEAMAQALFKSWFVDFEPFGGVMPNDWREGIFSDFFDVSIGRTPPRKEQYLFTKNKKDYVWVSIADMGRSGMFIQDSSEYLTADAVANYNVPIVQENTVILSFKLTVGRVAITTKNLTTNEAIAHLKTKDMTLTEYIYLFLKNFNFESLGNTSSIATAVNSKTIKAISVFIPSHDVLNEFHKITSLWFEKIKKNQIENTELTKLRDTLLPKLINGEINL